MVGACSPPAVPKVASVSAPDHTPPLRRLRVRKSFLAAAKGPYARRKLVVVQALRREDSLSDIGAGFTATRKIGGAVVRNRAKRRLREAVRQHLPEQGLPGCDYVFIARRDTATAPWPDLLDDIQAALVSLRNRLVPPEEPSSGRPTTSELSCNRKTTPSD